MTRTKVWQLENGIKVVNIPTFYEHFIVFFIFDVGNHVLRPEQSGFAHLLEHLMFKGTSEIGSLDYEKEKIILERAFDILNKVTQKTDLEVVRRRNLEALGLENEARKYYNIREFDYIMQYLGDAIANAYTFCEYTTYAHFVPREFINDFWRLQYHRFTDWTLRDFVRERNVVLQEMITESPIINMLLKTTYGEHYHSMPIIGYPKNIITARPQDIIQIQRDYYTANRLTILIAGNLTSEEQAVLSEVFSNFRQGKTENPNYPEASYQYNKYHFYFEKDTPKITFTVRMKTESTKHRIMAAILRNIDYAFIFERKHMNISTLFSVDKSYIAFSVLFDYNDVSKNGFIKYFDSMEGLINDILNDDSYHKEFLSRVERALNHYKIALIKAAMYPCDMHDLIIDMLLNAIQPESYDEFVDTINSIRPREILDFWLKLMGQEAHYAAYSPWGDKRNSILDEIITLPIENIDKTQSYYKISNYTRYFIQKMHTKEPVKIEHKKYFTHRSSFLPFERVLISNVNIKSENKVGDMYLTLQDPNLNIAYLEVLNRAFRSVASSLSYFHSFVCLDESRFNLKTSISIDNAKEVINSLNELLSNIVAQIYDKQFYKSHVKGYGSYLYLLSRDYAMSAFKAHIPFLYVHNWRRLAITSVPKISQKSFEAFIKLFVRNAKLYLALAHPEARKLAYLYAPPSISLEEEAAFKGVRAKALSYRESNGFLDLKVRKPEHAIIARVYPLGKVTPVKMGLTTLLRFYLSDQAFGTMWNSFRTEKGLVYGLEVTDIVRDNMLYLLFVIKTNLDSFQEALDYLNTFMNSDIEKINWTSYEFVLYHYSHLFPYYVECYGLYPGTSYTSAIVHHTIKNTSLDYSGEFYAYQLSQLIKMEELKEFIKHAIVNNSYSEITISDRQPRRKL
jgi:predicted Zn-dependent peptidase